MAERLPSLVLSTSSAPEVSFEVALDVSTPVDQSVHEKLVSLVGLLAQVGEHGGFAGSGVSPSQSQMFVAPGDSAVSGGFSCGLMANSIDIRAFQLLRNMLARLGLQGIDVTRIVVRELGQKEHRPVDVPEPNEQNEYDVYPGISSNMGLKVEGEDSDFSKSRRCLVETRSPIEADHVLGIGDWIRPWYLLLEAGAFAMPVGPPDETDSFSGSVTIFDEVTAEISVDRFQASETAWNVLINMLEAYSCAKCPIAKVIID